MMQGLGGLRWHFIPFYLVRFLLKSFDPKKIQSVTFLPSTIPVLGASLIHPWGFMQSYCCGVKQKTQNKLKESLPIVPLVDSSLTDCKPTATKEISTEELYQELK